MKIKLEELINPTDRQKMENLKTKLQAERDAFFYRLTGWPPPTHPDDSRLTSIHSTHHIPR